MSTNFNQRRDGYISLLSASMLPENISKFLSRSDLLVSVRYDKLIIYKGRDSALHGSKRDKISDLNLTKRKYNGLLSASAIKFISNQLNIWYSSIEYHNRKKNIPLKDRSRQLIFATMTLPSAQQHTDQEIKRHILMQFIDKLKYHYNIEHYFWRAEKQENGNIHFHCVFDKYIDMKEFQNLWNETCNILSYIDRFQKIHGHRNPPSCQIRMINTAKYTFKYLLKYTTKASTNIPVAGKLWGMSDSLRQLRQYTSFDFKNHADSLLKLISDAKERLYFEEHFLSVPLPCACINFNKQNYFINEYKNHLHKIYYYLYNSDPIYNEDQADTFLRDLDFDEIKTLTKAYDNLTA